MSEDALEEEEEEDAATAATEEPEHHEQDTQEKAVESNCLISVASERARGKAELVIDDSPMCMVEEPQHQHRQPQHLNPLVCATSLPPSARPASTTKNEVQPSRMRGGQRR